MPRKNRTHHSDHGRRTLAQETARLLAENGTRSFQAARSKAAARLGISDKRLLPTQAEIEEALATELRLFRGDRQTAVLQQLRLLAMKAMQAFANFRPRLIGAVLQGIADEHSPIQLQLFSETPEAVAMHLLELHIPWEQRERSFRYADGKRLTQPAFLLHTPDAEYELWVLPLRDAANPPLNPLTERPERGADLNQLQRLMNETPQRSIIGT